MLSNLIRLLHKTASALFPSAASSALASTARSKRRPRVELLKALSLAGIVLSRAESFKRPLFLHLSAGAWPSIYAAFWDDAKALRILQADALSCRRSCMTHASKPESSGILARDLALPPCQMKPRGTRPLTRRPMAGREALKPPD